MLLRCGLDVLESDCWKVLLPDQRDCVNWENLHQRPRSHNYRQCPQSSSLFGCGQVVWWLIRIFSGFPQIGEEQQQSAGNLRAPVFQQFLRHCRFAQLLLERDRKPHQFMVCFPVSTTSSVPSVWWRCFNLSGMEAQRVIVRILKEITSVLGTSYCDMSRTLRYQNWNLEVRPQCH